MTLPVFSLNDPLNKDWPHLLSLPRQYLARPSVKLTEHSHCYVGQSGTCSRHPGAAWSLLHPPLHGHGANVPPAPVQAPGGLLDGVALSLVGTGIGVVQEDVADVKHRLHPCTVLFYVSLQVLQRWESRKHVEVLVAVLGRFPPTLLPARGGTVLRAFLPGTWQHRLSLSHLWATPVRQYLTQGLTAGNNGIDLLN